MRTKFLMQEHIRFAGEYLRDHLQTFQLHRLEKRLIDQTPVWILIPESAHGMLSEGKLS